MLFHDLSVESKDGKNGPLTGKYCELVTESIISFHSQESSVHLLETVAGSAHAPTCFAGDPSLNLAPNSTFLPFISCGFYTIQCNEIKIKIILKLRKCLIQRAVKCIDLKMAGEKLC